MHCVWKITIAVQTGQNLGQFPADVFMYSLKNQELSECDVRFASLAAILVCCSFYTWQGSIVQF